MKTTVGGFGALANVCLFCSPHSDLYVTVQLWADSKPLTVPVQTAYKPFKHERKLACHLAAQFCLSMDGANVFKME